MTWGTIIVVALGAALFGYCIGRSHAERIQRRERQSREASDQVNALLARVIELERRS